MKLDSGMMLVIFLQTLAYVVAGWKYVSGLKIEINDLKTKLKEHEAMMDMRIQQVEVKDTEINQRLTRMENMLVEIRLELKDKKDRNE